MSNPNGQGEPNTVFIYFQGLTSWKSHRLGISPRLHVWNDSCLAMAVRVLSSMSLQEKEIHNQFVWILHNKFACIQMMI
jgi:hypothetical protein